MEGGPCPPSGEAFLQKIETRSRLAFGPPANLKGGGAGLRARRILAAAGRPIKLRTFIMHRRDACATKLSVTFQGSDMRLAHGA
jgi:hypothetical protein